jgi:hypothetical protein
MNGDGRAARGDGNRDLIGRWMNLQMEIDTTTCLPMWMEPIVI